MPRRRKLENQAERRRIPRPCRARGAYGIPNLSLVRHVHARWSLNPISPVRAPSEMIFKLAQRGLRSAVKAID
ncbi:hypothetical protein EVAR_77706_1 [Eumeta japonica]|uniref:Uncharacterized protein n=1 Tax=Eumeta variegata TaxID=151549 RepID=A0A4C1TAN3_EUMVA|nr:hypothetical protein EVAR_77706_1 [Eumeta japonica]